MNLISNIPSSQLPQYFYLPQSNPPNQKNIDTPSCKEALDAIDKDVTKKALKGFYESRLAILMGEWEKGKAIGKFTGGKIASWRELERKTGRNHESLKKWYDLYIRYPDHKDYLKVAKKKALSWTNKALSAI